MRLSVVTPVYNEEQNIPLLYEAVFKALEPLDIAWELILVDDGSRDNSLTEMEKAAVADPLHVRLVELRRNFGQTAAIAAGIDRASGDVVVLTDADLQNDPADIPMMLEKIEEGYDVV
ncbi:MAG: glycosyltransferase family 2 protein, partial [Planctomycetes bacterium]|nr:glycosyltransferase family 2 protein [Planctomycetota bacterium]